MRQKPWHLTKQLYRWRRAKQPKFMVTFTKCTTRARSNRDAENRTRCYNESQCVGGLKQPNHRIPDDSDQRSTPSRTRMRQRFLHPSLVTKHPIQIECSPLAFGSHRAKNITSCPTAGDPMNNAEKMKAQPTRKFNRITPKPNKPALQETLSP